MSKLIVCLTLICLVVLCGLANGRITDWIYSTHKLNSKLKQEFEATVFEKIGIAKPNVSYHSITHPKIVNLLMSNIYRIMDAYNGEKLGFDEKKWTSLFQMEWKYSFPNEKASVVTVFTPNIHPISKQEKLNLELGKQYDKEVKLMSREINFSQFKLSPNESLLATDLMIMCRGINEDLLPNGYQPELKQNWLNITISMNVFNMKIVVAQKRVRIISEGNMMFRIKPIYATMIALLPPNLRSFIVDLYGYYEGLKDFITVQIYEGDQDSFDFQPVLVTFSRPLKPNESAGKGQINLRAKRAINIIKGSFHKYYISCPSRNWTQPELNRQTTTTTSEPDMHYNVNEDYDSDYYDQDENQDENQDEIRNKNNANEEYEYDDFVPKYYKFSRVSHLNLDCGKLDLKTNEPYSLEAGLKYFLSTNLFEQRPKIRCWEYYDQIIHNDCSRYFFDVNITDFGWDWVIFPKYYTTGFCGGKCSQITQCVPTKLYPLNLIYYAAENTYVARQIPEMIIDRCGCQKEKFVYGKHIFQNSFKPLPNAIEDCHWVRIN